MGDDVLLKKENRFCLTTGLLPSAPRTAGDAWRAFRHLHHTRAGVWVRAVFGHFRRVSAPAWRQCLNECVRQRLAPPPAERYAPPRDRRPSLHPDAPALVAADRARHRVARLHGAVRIRRQRQRRRPPPGRPLGRPAGRSPRAGTGDACGSKTPTSGAAGSSAPCRPEDALKYGQFGRRAALPWSG